MVSWRLRTEGRRASRSRVLRFVAAGSCALLAAVGPRAWVVGELGCFSVGRAVGEERRPTSASGL
eukprot:10701708-Alexandrium_andersonii.AAC.1